MTFDELEEKGFHAVYAEYERGSQIIEVFIYHLKDKGTYTAHIVRRNKNTDQYEQPVFTGHFNSLFETKISLTFEYLIPVTKLDWRGQ